MGSRILVVDDRESLRHTFEKFLTDEGHNVTTAGNFSEAAALLRQEEFDIIFADIILGDRTGVDLLKVVKAKGLQCPFILVARTSNFETASDSARYGAFDYIPKPVTQEALLRVTRVALKHKQALDEKEKYRSNLEAIFRSVKDGIITVDKGMRIIEMNSMAQRICGYSKEDAAKGTVNELHDGCLQKCVGALTETFKKKKPLELNRIQCHRKNLSRQIVSISTTPLIDKQGEFTGAVMVLRDETRLAELEQDMEERSQFHTIVGKSGQMQRIYALIDQLADFQTTVLVRGESGTGKELIADALHYRGVRCDRPLIKVNCAALPESLLESELFGHAKGSFTTAIKDKVGGFQKADGGTIFLDEIGDISPRVQIRLLRFLQEMEFERVGDAQPVKVDVRVIASTNKDLFEKVKKGDFREDLYYRMRVIEIVLPPLRERKEDISLLVGHFIEKFNKKFDKQIKSVSPEVLDIFMGYNWPGNIRELEHALEYAFILCRTNIISSDNLPRELHASIKTAHSAGSGAGNVGAETIREALRKTGGNKSKASRLLGISRRTIYRRMDELHIAEDT